MKVLHVLDSFSFGGAENLVVELARHAPAGMELRAASLAPPGRGRDAMWSRMDEAGLGPVHLGVRRLADPAGFVRLVRGLNRLAPDVVHAHLGYSATLVPLAARAAGIGCVATLHHTPEDLPLRERLKERWSVRVPSRFGVLVLVSTPSFEGFARRHGPASATWRLVPNGVDLSRFHPLAQPRGNVVPTWACVAALREPKGHLDLLRAWQLLRDRGVHARLLIVGDGPHRSVIERAVESLELGDCVELLGRREDVPDLLASVDGVVSASHLEALPTALIEAGAAGLPVVTTDAGGSTDVVTPQTGWIARAHDVTGLADALGEAIVDPAEAARRGAAGRVRVADVFSMTTWTTRLTDLYREVAHAPTHQSAGKEDPCPTTSTP